MPIKIYIKGTSDKVDWLCDEIWDLPNQIAALETWLDEGGRNLESNEYVADIGFDIRRDASGGGAVLNSRSMAIMGKIGMDVHFSEYPEAD